MKRSGERRETIGRCNGCMEREADDQVKELHVLRVPWFGVLLTVTAPLCWECWRLVWQLSGEDPLGTFRPVPKKRRRVRLRSTK